MALHSIPLICSPLPPFDAGSDASKDISSTWSRRPSECLLPTMDSFFSSRTKNRSKTITSTTSGSSFAFHRSAQVVGNRILPPSLSLSSPTAPSPVTFKVVLRQPRGARGGRVFDSDPTTGIRKSILPGRGDSLFGSYFSSEGYQKDGRERESSSTTDLGVFIPKRAASWDSPLVVSSSTRLPLFSSSFSYVPSASSDTILHNHNTLSFSVRGGAPQVVRLTLEHPPTTVVGLLRLLGALNDGAEWVGCGCKGCGAENAGWRVRRGNNEEWIIKKGIIREKPRTWQKVAKAIQRRRPRIKRRLKVRVVRRGRRARIRAPLVLCESVGGTSDEEDDYVHLTKSSNAMTSDSRTCGGRRPLAGDSSGCAALDIVEEYVKSPVFADGALASLSTGTRSETEKDRSKGKGLVRTKSCAGLKSRGGSGIWVSQNVLLYSIHSQVLRRPYKSTTADEGRIVDKESGEEELKERKVGSRAEEKEQFEDLWIHSDCGIVAFFEMLRGEDRRMGGQAICTKEEGRSKEKEVNEGPRGLNDWVEVQNNERRSADDVEDTSVAPQRSAVNEAGEEMIEEKKKKENRTRVVMRSNNHRCIPHTLFITLHRIKIAKKEYRKSPLLSVLTDPSSNGNGGVSSLSTTGVVCGHKLDMPGDPRRFPLEATVASGLSKNSVMRSRCPHKSTTHSNQVQRDVGYWSSYLSPSLPFPPPRLSCSSTALTTINSKDKEMSSKGSFQCSSSISSPTLVLPVFDVSSAVLVPSVFDSCLSPFLGLSSSLDVHSPVSESEGSGLSATSFPSSSSPSSCSSFSSDSSSLISIPASPMGVRWCDLRPYLLEALLPTALSRLFQEIALSPLFTRSLLLKRDPTPTTPPLVCPPPLPETFDGGSLAHPSTSDFNIFPYLFSALSSFSTSHPLGSGRSSYDFSMGFSEGTGKKASPVSSFPSSVHTTESETEMLVIIHPPSTRDSGGEKKDGCVPVNFHPPSKVVPPLSSSPVVSSRCAGSSSQSSSRSSRSISSIPCSASESISASSWSYSPVLTPPIWPLPSDLSSFDIPLLPPSLTLQGRYPGGVKGTATSKSEKEQGEQTMTDSSINHPVSSNIQLLSLPASPSQEPVLFPSLGTSTTFPLPFPPSRPSIDGFALSTFYSTHEGIRDTAFVPQGPNYDPPHYVASTESETTSSLSSASISSSSSSSHPYPSYYGSVFFPPILHNHSRKLYNRQPAQQPAYDKTSEPRVDASSPSPPGSCGSTVVGSIRSSPYLLPSSLSSPIFTSSSSEPSITSTSTFLPSTTSSSSCSLFSCFRNILGNPHIGPCTPPLSPFVLPPSATFEPVGASDLPRRAKEGTKDWRQEEGLRRDSGSNICWYDARPPLFSPVPTTWPCHPYSSVPSSPPSTFSDDEETFSRGRAVSSGVF